MKNDIHKSSWIVILFIIFSFELFAQSVVSFTPRSSQKAPLPYKGVSTYNIQGDFVMLGNTNMTLASYNDLKNNNSNPMVVVDKDNDGTTYNSSMAELKLGTLASECSEILYAGLYWTGRAENSGTESSYVTYNNKNYFKNKVKFKKEGKTYFEVDAVNQIAYPGSSNSFIYVGYADITDYVRAEGVGNYWVADMALLAGTNQTGYFGGWGMVVVYKNSAMKWRDITVFDGYSYISANGSAQTLDISGFKAVQSGDVKVKMGLMAGEGDVVTTEDYIEMRQRLTNNYTKLSHTNNTTDNFFNSSIFTGGNNRNPITLNNTGMDISMFDLPNDGNVLINNNQNSTRFRYGTNGDLYSIFSIVFAVDAYVPEVIGENTPANANTIHGTPVIPGQELEFDLKMYNKGEEAVKDLKVEIPIPFNVHYDGATIVIGSNSTIKIPSNTTVTWTPPVGSAPGATPQNTLGGTLVWNIGDLPKDLSKSILQGTLKYKLKVTANCAFLATAGPCALQVSLNGKITGKGATSNSVVSSDLVREYGIGACAGPIYDDFKTTITVDEAFLQACNLPVDNKNLQFKAFCSLLNNEFPRAQIVDLYPLGTKFFNQVPSSFDSNVGVVSNGFAVPTNGTKTKYYAMIPGMDPGCYIGLETSLEVINSSPTAKDVAFCEGDNVVLDVVLSSTGVANGYGLYYFSTETDTTPLTSPPSPTDVDVYTFWVAEGKVSNGILCTGPKVSFTITINPLPVVAQDVAKVSTCENNDYSLNVSTTAVSNFNWEYASVTSPTVWNPLDNSTFSSVISVSNGTLNISHATKVIDGIKVRLIGKNNTDCEKSSNEISIEIKDCQVITNPMLPNKSKN